MVPIVYYAIPVFFALIALEGAWFRRVRASSTPSPVPAPDAWPDSQADPHAAPYGAIPSTGAPRLGYFGPDTRGSLSMGLANVVVTVLLTAPVFALYDWLFAHRVLDLGAGPVAFLSLFVIEDFVYYWWHRASHEVRFLWSAHVNHHSSQYLNLSTALRQSWTTPLTTPLFYFTLPLLGFSPAAMTTQVSISLIYQFWLHTETIDRMPRWFEFVFNTPSHHRAHHGSNVEYLDRNHGGILIVWDRLFGTFEPERAPVVYGLTKNIETHSLLRMAFHDWIDLIRSIATPAPLRTRLAYVFAEPGWSADGSSKTAAQLKAEGADTRASAPS